MLTTIIFRFPSLSMRFHMALQSVLWAVGLLAALALCVAVLVAVAPYLPTLLVGVAGIAGYAVATYPRTGVRSCHE